jgi:hypothetical protein
MNFLNLIIIFLLNISKNNGLRCNLYNFTTLQGFEILIGINTAFKDKK